MVTKLVLRNFKAWREKIEIDLAPVNILLGVNSSGKSSLLQAFLLLKQTAASPDRSIHLNFGGDEINEYFNFGHFEDVLTHGASPRQFEIGFDFDRPDPLRDPRSNRPARRLIQKGHYSATFGMTSSGAAVVQELVLKADGHAYRAVRREKGAYSIFVDDESQPRGKSRSYAPERSMAFSAEAIQLMGLDGSYAQDISLAIRRELENITYLGPLRRKPERDYVWNKTRPGEFGTDGSGVINAIFASALQRAKDDGPERIIQDVSSWLQLMGVADSLEVRQLGHSTRYEIVIHKDRVAANLRDVGIGISQVFPVLTIAYFAPPGATILLEEPEIHLHPLAQSVLAELFVKVSQQRGIQFIVETHSEHLFRRLQTLIASERVSSADCRLYFVEREGSDAVLRRLELDQYGRLAEWPDRFFGDALGETREQARLLFERQKKERAA